MIFFELREYAADAHRKELAAFKIREMCFGVVGVGKVEHHRLGGEVKGERVEEEFLYGLGIGHGYKFNLTTQVLHHRCFHLLKHRKPKTLLRMQFHGRNS